MEDLSSHAWVNGQLRAEDTQQEQFMAQNFNNDALSHSSEGPPGYGLMSRTLVHSPVIKQIIPARIRNRELNDVAFIGETFIELHLLTDDGKLRQVGSKTDFQANIRHARVFGSPRKNFHSPQDAIFKQELATQSQDDVVMHGVGEGGVNGGMLSGAAEGDDSKPLLPPHILALTLDSGHLAFVYAKNSEEQGEVNFVVSMKRIDQKGIRMETLGKSIAVDPRYATHSECMLSILWRCWSANCGKGSL
ncbi:hypothetical protein L873DRAFT_1830268 [Choiromyces venosus 120613-1]|uniref:RSE1/DDB1/CPSF1 first beta-propeller domain-containing protein n=1 Tax=Choiromyces venosus 120613-1 TaxID=1336337 RepID=A0A3N4J833_9PEZI|nr:hypothetical protein L873DRAFT_1830268 [Choiromyces venosus 120613-1]